MADQENTNKDEGAANLDTTISEDSRVSKFFRVACKSSLDQFLAGCTYVLTTAYYTILCHM